MGLTLHQHGHTHSGASPKEHGHGHKSVENGGAHGHSHDVNINVRAALIHVIGDFIQSLGVFIAAIVIYYKVPFRINRQTIKLVSFNPFDWYWIPARMEHRRSHMHVLLLWSGADYDNGNHEGYNQCTYGGNSSWSGLFTSREYLHANWRSTKSSQSKNLGSFVGQDCSLCTSCDK